MFIDANVSPGKAAWAPIVIAGVSRLPRARHRRRRGGRARSAETGMSARRESRTSARGPVRGSETCTCALIFVARTDILQQQQHVHVQHVRLYIGKFWYKSVPTHETRTPSTRRTRAHWPTLCRRRVAHRAGPGCCSCSGSERSRQLAQMRSADRTRSVRPRRPPATTTSLWRLEAPPPRPHRAARMRAIDSMLVRTSTAREGCSRRTERSAGRQMCVPER